MSNITVTRSTSDSTFLVIQWTYPTATSFRGEVMYETGCFETANAVCEQLTLDADPAYQDWLMQQDAEFA